MTQHSLSNTVQLHQKNDGNAFLPLPRTQHIQIFDYVLVTVKPNQAIVVEKYDHPEKYIPNTFLNPQTYISFINYDRDYLKQQTARKQVLSHHQN